MIKSTKYGTEEREKAPDEILIELILESKY